MALATRFFLAYLLLNVIISGSTYPRKCPGTNKDCRYEFIGSVAILTGIFFLSAFLVAASQQPPPPLEEYEKILAKYDEDNWNGGYVYKYHQAKRDYPKFEVDSNTLIYHFSHSGTKLTEEKHFAAGAREKTYAVGCYEKCKDKKTITALSYSCLASCYRSLSIYYLANMCNKKSISKQISSVNDALGYWKKGMVCLMKLREKLPSLDKQEKKLRQKELKQKVAIYKEDNPWNNLQNHEDNKVFDDFNSVFSEAENED